MKTQFQQLLECGISKLTWDADFDTFKELSPEERRFRYFIDGNIPMPKMSLYVYKKDENIVFAVKTLEWKFGQNRFYPHSTFRVLATVTPKRVICYDINDLFGKISRALGLSSMYISNSKHYRNSDLRNFVKGTDVCDLGIDYSYNEGISTCFSYYFTDYSVINNRVKKEELDIILIRDLAVQARALNKKINSNWSARKCSDIHHKWTEEITALKGRNASKDTIWNIEGIHTPDNIQLINSEYECLIEGTKMHHCLYSNYSRPILNKQYIAFHVLSESGEFTVGLRVYKHIISRYAEYDQAYGKYNKPLSEEQMALLPEVTELADKILNNNLIDCPEDISFPESWDIF